MRSVGNAFGVLNDVFEVIMEEKVHIRRADLQGDSYRGFSEKVYDLRLDGPDNNGFKFKEVSFRNAQIISCEYQLDVVENISLDIESKVLEMHFRLSGSSSAVCDDGLQLGMGGGEHSLFFHCDGGKRIEMQPTLEQGRFVELRTSLDAVEKLFVEGNDFQKRFFEQLGKERHYWPGHSLQINPEMLAVLHQLDSCAYSGMMKGFYLEVKTIELLLMQVNAYDGYRATEESLSQTDREKLHAVKEYIDANIGSVMTLALLSEMVMMPVKKMTTGFKQLFNCTVFDYKTEVMMQEAKYLLIDQKWYVSEVSDRMGYKNPQHFTVAFKRRFGFLPSSLKS